MEKYDVLKKLRENGNQLRGLGVKRLGLFGSLVRGEQNSDSDIDLLVEFEKGKKTFDNFMTVSFFWKTYLGRGLSSLPGNP